MSECLHVEAVARVMGHALPYCAHIRTTLSSGIEEVVDGVHIQLDHEHCSDRALSWLNTLDQRAQQALFDSVSHEALAIFNMKRLRGEQIEGEDKLS